MIEQPTDVGMMQCLGGRRVTVALGNIRIRHEQFNQRLQMRILKARDELGQRPPQFAYILGRLRQVVGEVDLGFRHAPQFVNRQLKPILVFVDQALDLEKVILLEAEDELIDVVPHLGFNLPRAVCQDQCQIGLAVFLRLNLLRRHHEARGNDLVLLITTFGYEELFHEPPPNRWCRTQRLKAHVCYRNYRHARGHALIRILCAAHLKVESPRNAPLAPG